MVTDTAGIYKRNISFVLVKKKTLLLANSLETKVMTLILLSLLSLQSLPYAPFIPLFLYFSILRIKINLPVPPARHPRSSPGHTLTLAHPGNATTPNIRTGPVSLCFTVCQSLIWAGQSCPVSSLGCSYSRTQFPSTRGCNMDTRADQPITEF